MQRVLAYQLQLIGSSLAWVVWWSVTVGLTLMVNHLAQPPEAEIKYPGSLASLQMLLMAAWAFQGLYLPYLASHAADQARESGLLEWWLARGLSPWRVALAQSLAILLAATAYLLFLVTPLALWILSMQGTIPWRLLLENEGLYLVSAEILVLLTLLLGTLINHLIAYLVGVGLWLMAILGGPMVMGFLAQFHGPGKVAAYWLWYLLPRFELYHRPLALVYHWAPCPGSVLVSVLAYSGVYGFLLLIGCESFYRPRYGR